MPVTNSRLNALKKHGEVAYPIYTWYAIAGMIGIAIFVNLCTIAWSWKQRRGQNGSPGRAQTSGRNGSASPRRLPQAFVTASRIFAFRWRIPVIGMVWLELILTAAYLVLLLTLEFVNTQGLQIRYWANRAGHLAAIQLPLVVALSSKNNIIQLLTGVSHEKLNVIHRMFARVVFLLVWIHLWAKVAQGSSAIFTTRWRSLGVGLAVVFTLLILISLRPVRMYFYEFFYIAHVTLVFIILILTYLHTAGAGYGYYVWPAFVLWGLDRLCRTVRALVLNVASRRAAVNGHLELITPDLLYLTVKRRVPGGWRAGQYMFVGLPTLKKMPLESHPFTIATIPGEEMEKELLFVIKAKNGMTKIMKEYVELNGDCQVPVYLDGPYGAPTDNTPYTTCIFLAAGSGVSYTLSRLRELLLQVSGQRACAQRVVFIWVVRHQSHLKGISQYLAQAASSVPSTVSLSISIYITSPAQSEDGASSQSSSNDHEKALTSIGKAGSPKDSAETLAIEGVNILSGRPDLHEILKDEVTASSGPVSVDVSGPTAFASRVRSALSSPFAGPTSVLKGTPTVQLNVETFGS